MRVPSIHKLLPFLAALMTVALVAPVVAQGPAGTPEELAQVEKISEAAGGYLAATVRLEVLIRETCKDELQSVPRVASGVQAVEDIVKRYPRWTYDGTRPGWPKDSIPQAMARFREDFEADYRVRNRRDLADFQRSQGKRDACNQIYGIFAAEWARQQQAIERLLIRR
jgi:hypothetical protein